MPTVNKYRLHCTTDDVDEFVWAEAPPTKCPTDTAHTIDAGSVAIVDSVSPIVRQTQAVLSTTGLTLAGFGFKFTALKGVETTHEHKLVQTVRLRGGLVETKNQAMGDTLTMEVVDVDNVLGYGAGAVLSDYFTDWNVPQGGREEILEPSIGKVIPKDLYVRVKYKSVGATDDVDVAVNFRAYKE